MLAGTLITCAGFTPIGFSKGVSSEFCKSIFPVITLSLLISWVVSVMVTPLFGTYLIPARAVSKKEPGNNETEKEGEKQDWDIYDKPFYRAFRRLLILCLRFRFIVLLLTLAGFAASLYGFKFVKQEFFPGSVRPELIVELTLPQGASLAATGKQAAAFARAIETNPAVDHFASYVGSGAPRFVLTFDPVLPPDQFRPVHHRGQKPGRQKTAAKRHPDPSGHLVSRRSRPHQHLAAGAARALSRHAAGVRP